MNLIDALKWRYAAKRMNGQAVPQEKVDRILEAIRLSASSMGLQPYTILSITNPDLKRKIKSASYNQPQVVEGSHILVFAAWRNISTDQVDDYMNDISRIREVAEESLSDFRKSLISMIEKNTEEQNFEWAARQIYLALGTALTAAAVERVDATPMEGFQPERVDEILDLKDKQLRSVSILALGYRDEENDFLAGAKKVRRPKDKLILELN
jgi:nitroreductase / dihydropteridine reductase